MDIINGDNRIEIDMAIPIPKSARDQLKELQEEYGHDNLGETIGWLIDEVEDCHALCSEFRDELEQAVNRED